MLGFQGGAVFSQQRSLLHAGRWQLIARTASCLQCLMGSGYRTQQQHCVLGRCLLCLSERQVSWARQCMVAAGAAFCCCMGSSRVLLCAVGVVCESGLVTLSGGQEQVQSVCPIEE